MKVAKRYMKFILVVFAKNHLAEDKWVFVGSKMQCPHNSGSALTDLFMILHTERSKKTMEVK